jgi:hypothetical protein
MAVKALLIAAIATSGVFPSHVSAQWAVPGGDGYQTSPAVIFVVAQPQPPPEPPQPPPPPVQPVMHEYHWPEAGAPASTAFSIVSSDGVVRSALVVWVQDNTLYYTATDGTRGQLALSTINRAATDRLNTEKKLKLPLPPGRY